MRVIESAATSGHEPWDQEAIERARDLAERIPEAGLRPVALIRARSLDRRADVTGATRVFLALENLQVTGSFKVRGAVCALLRARRLGAPAVTAASAGNHGIGVARAARILGIRATIMVPATIPDTKLVRIIREGAEVRRVPGAYDDAEQAAMHEAQQLGAPFISPYDDVDVLTGNGTSLAFELVKSLGRVPEHVLAPVGGGGLATGLAWGLAVSAQEAPGQQRRVWTAQSEACPAFAESLRLGRACLQMRPSSPTLAEGLEGGISDAAFSRAASAVAGVFVVSEPSIAAAMRYVYAALGLRIEGSAAVALTPVLEGLPHGARGGDVIVVLTGRNVDLGTFDTIAAGFPLSAVRERGDTGAFDRGA